MNINLPNAAPGGPSVSGAMSFTDVQELNKALTAGYGTDVSTLTGGGALRIQSLDKTLMAVVQENKHFVLFNMLSKGDATATVDEWTEQSGVGGFLGGSTNSETGNIAATQGTYNRRVGLVKYLMTQRQVSFVQTLQNTITDSEAVEENNGALQLLTDAEYLCFEGDSTVVPTEFDGIYAQINGFNGGAQVIDLQGAALSSIGPVNQAASLIAKYGNFGTPTDLIFSTSVQADFDTGLDPAFRVSIDSSGRDVMLGAPVKGIRTSSGDIATHRDVFVRDEVLKIPFEINFAAVAAANNFAPASVTPGSPASNAASLFTAANAGNYYYYVTGVNGSGQSVGVVSSQVSIAAGQGVAIVIAHSTANTETGYVIYRSRLGGGNTVTRTDKFVSDFREMVRIPVSGGATTTYTDIGAEVPGSTKAFMLNMTPGQKSITWRKLLPMIRFPLYPTVSAVIPWAQLMFGYLRIAKRPHHAVFKNIVPSNAVWKPFQLT